MEEGGLSAKAVIAPALCVFLIPSSRVCNHEVNLRDTGTSITAPLRSAAHWKHTMEGREARAPVHKKVSQV